MVANTLQHLIRSTTMIKLSSYTLHRNCWTDISIFILTYKIFNILCYKCLPSGCQKFYTHLRSSCSLEHLDQVGLSRQVVKCKDRKCGYWDRPRNTSVESWFILLPLSRTVLVAGAKIKFVSKIS